MHVLIEKDGQTTTREVEDLDAAQALADAGETVLVPNKDGGHRALAGCWPEAVITRQPDGRTRVDSYFPGNKPPAPAPAKKAAAKPKGFLAKVKAAITPKKK